MHNSFEVQAFGTGIRAAGSSPAASALLERCIFPSLPRKAANGEAPHLALWLEEAAGKFELSAGDVSIGSATEAMRLAPEVVRVVDETVIRRLEDLRAMHAAVVAFGDRALLLPAATHSGKSSLAAELLRRGATYYSDEYALIDRQGRVHPYPRPLLLRDGRPEQIPVLPEECGSRAGIGPAPIRWIVGLRYLPGKAWHVSPVPQSEGVLLLLQNTPHVWARTPDLLETLSQAVAGAACFVGTRGEAAEAAEQILRLVEAQ